MVGSSSSKILTVSYGTFSCTLEGFDDPFSTMRHIAEYFRDLAADDRYFGAEPPTPDAEMLHRIAEREIQRRVEARVTGESVVLRQLDTGLAEDEADESAAEAIAAPARRAVSRPEPEPVPEPEIADEDEVAAAAIDTRSGSIEEKLSRIRAVVQRTRSRDVAAGLAAAATEEADADEEAMVADMSPGFASDIDTSLISQVMAEQAAGDDRAPEDDAPLAAEPLWDFDVSGESESDTQEEEDEEEQEAAVVAETGDDPEAEAPVEAERASEDEPEVTFDESGAGDEIETDEPEDETAWSGALRYSGAEEDAVADESPEPGDDPDEDADTAEDTDERTDAAIARIMMGGDDAGTEDTVEVAALQPDEPEVAETHEPEIMLDAGGADTDEEDEDDVHTAASAEADEEEDERDDEPTDDLWEVDFDAEPVADEAEKPAEAGRALDLEEDGSSDWHADADADAAPKDAATLESARAERALSKSSQLRAPEEENDRLQSRTESAFADNEGSRRRSAIAHLKAAVAATRADKILSRVVGRDRATDPEEQRDYREDLSKVVKSRPLSQQVPPADMSADAPTGAEDAMPEEDEATLDLTPTIEDEEDEAQVERTARVKTRLLGPEDRVSSDDFFDDFDEEDDHEEAATARTSPLMLVSELRVGGKVDEGVRPRRISRELTGEERGIDDGKGFAEFAERMGANDLADLMEAAAAYTAYVENQPHFSRPQIMRRVAKVDPSIEESREAGLRSFGQLLRQGRIQKLQRGQFTVSDTTRFKPQQRYAGE